MPSSENNVKQGQENGLRKNAFSESRSSIFDDLHKEQAGPGQSCEVEQDASDLCILSVQNTHQLILMASRHLWGRNLVSSDAVKADIAT